MSIELNHIIIPAHSGHAVAKARSVIFAGLHDRDPPRDLAGVSPI
jgi:hypothetical protein